MGSIIFNDDGTWGFDAGGNDVELILAFMMGMQGNDAGAVRLLDNYLRENASECVGYFLRGSSKLYLNDMAGALYDFAFAVSLLNLKTDQSNLHRMAGDNCRAAGEMCLALYHYDQALQLNIDNHYAVFGRGQTYIQSGEYELGVRDLEWFVTARPGDPATPAAYILLGDAYRSMRRMRRSAYSYVRYIQYLRRKHQGTYKGILSLNATATLDLRAGEVYELTIPVRAGWKLKIQADHWDAVHPLVLLSTNRKPLVGLHGLPPDELDREIVVFTFPTDGIYTLYVTQGLNLTGIEGRVHVTLRD
jgi:tetratricopeptide (TPR) repeat protein